MSFNLSQTSADSDKKCKIYLPNDSEQQSVPPNPQNFVRDALSKNQIKPLGNPFFMANLVCIDFSAQTANSDIINFFCTFFRRSQGLESEIFLESPEWNRALNLLDESFTAKQAGLKKFIASDCLLGFRDHVNRYGRILELEKFELENTPEPTGINSSWFTDVMMFASGKRGLLFAKIAALPNDETIARRNLELAYFSELEEFLKSLLKNNS